MDSSRLSEMYKNIYIPAASAATCSDSISQPTLILQDRHTDLTGSHIQECAWWYNKRPHKSVRPALVSRRSSESSIN